MSGQARRPRLLVSASTYPRWPGDPEPGFVHELSKRLAKDFDVAVICPHSPGSSRHETMDGVSISRFRYGPVAWERLVHGGGMAANLRRRPILVAMLPAYAFGYWFDFARQVRIFRPDVIHAHWLIPHGLLTAAARLLGLALPPMVVTSHGGDLFALRGAISRRLKRFVVRNAARVSVVSRAMVAPIEALGATDVCVAPMGVDLERTFIPAGSDSSSRGELLFVGRLVEKKGLRFLFDAMPLIAASYPDVNLTIVGAGPEEAGLRDQADRLGIADRIRFEGAVSQCDLPKLYRRASVFVAPFVTARDGDEEGLGLVVLEAVGCGCPAVVGRVRAVEDIQWLAGQAISVVDPTSPDKLAAAVIKVLNDPEAAAAGVQAARAHLIEHASWTATARTYRRIIQEIIASKSAAAA